jgi:hypothetical protein
MSPVLQGSALWRALIQPARRCGASGCAKPRRSIRATPPVRAQGIEGVRSSHTCRGFLSPKGSNVTGTLVTVESHAMYGEALYAQSSMRCWNQVARRAPRTRFYEDPSHRGRPIRHAFLYCGGTASP